MKPLSRMLLVVLLAYVPFVHAQDFNEAARLAYQKEVQAASARGDLVTSGDDYERMQRIAHRLIAVAPEMLPGADAWPWEVAYIRSGQANAHCLPGGKIVVLSGLVDRLALTDDELAAALGHEMGHALLEHGKEGYTQRQTARVVVGILGLLGAVVAAKHHQNAGAAADATTLVATVGAEFFALRPYNRERELAADAFGAELAARAGFDPRSAISLQQKLGAQSTAIEFLSTHPAAETRIQQLNAVASEAAERFAARRSAPSTMVVAVAEQSAPSAPATSSVVATHTSPENAQALVRSAGPAPVSQQQTASPNRVAVVEPTTSAAVDDPDAVTGPAARLLTSRWTLTAERYVKNGGCKSPVAVMVARAATYESFAVTCSDGSALNLRCDDGRCKSMD